MDIIELKKQLDEHRNQLSDILRKCHDGTQEQALLEEKMRPLLDEFSETEDHLFTAFQSLTSSHQQENEK